MSSRRTSPQSPRRTCLLKIYLVVIVEATVIHNSSASMTSIGTAGEAAMDPLNNTHHEASQPPPTTPGIATLTNNFCTKSTPSPNDPPLVSIVSQLMIRSYCSNHSTFSRARRELCYMERAGIYGHRRQKLAPIALAVSSQGGGSHSITLPAIATVSLAAAEPLQPSLRL